MCKVLVFLCLSIYILPLSYIRFIFLIQLPSEVKKSLFLIRAFYILFACFCRFTSHSYGIRPLPIIMNFWITVLGTRMKRRKYTDLLFHSCYKMVAVLWFFFADTGVGRALLLTELLVIYEVILCLAVSMHVISQSVVHLCTNGTSKAECESLN